MPHARSPIRTGTSPELQVAPCFMHKAFSQRTHLDSGRVLQHEVCLGSAVDQGDEGVRESVQQRPLQLLGGQLSCRGMKRVRCSRRCKEWMAVLAVGSITEQDDCCSARRGRVLARHGARLHLTLAVRDGLPMKVAFLRLIANSPGYPYPPQPIQNLPLYVFHSSPSSLSAKGRRNTCACITLGVGRLRHHLHHGHTVAVCRCSRYTSCLHSRLSGALTALPRQPADLTPLLPAIE